MINTPTLSVLPGQVQMAMAAAATSERDPFGPVATWTYLELAQHL
jgi:hypothetical protein